MIGVAATTLGVLVWLVAVTLPWWIGFVVVYLNDNC